MRLPIARLPLLAVLWLMAVSASAVAQDAGTTEIPLICGLSLSDLGDCFGDTAAWCSEPNRAGESPSAQVESTDCAQFNARCVQLDTLGARCAADDGEACLYATNEGTAQLICGNGSQGPGPGCELSEGCISNAPACIEDALPTCAGADLILSCSEAQQATLIRCRGQCDEAASVCINEPAGAPCREGTAHCAEALDCLGEGDGRFGRCTARSPDLASSADAGSWAAEAPGGGCRCTAIPTGPSTAAGLAVIALHALWSGRRRPAFTAGKS